MIRVWVLSSALRRVVLPACGLLRVCASPDKYMWCCEMGRKVR